MLSHMCPWAKNWCPDNLFGGISKRSTEVVRSLLLMDYSDCDCYSMLSEDLEKAFDPYQLQPSGSSFVSL